MAGQSNRKAASGKRALASLPRRIGPSPVARLEPKTASSSLYAPAPTATSGGADRSGAFRLLPSYASVSCAACPFSPGLAPAAGSQRTYPNSKSGNHQALWRSRILCHLTGVGNSLTSVLKVIRIPSSRTSVLLRREPHGLSRSLPLTFSHFLSVFALHPSVFALSCCFILLFFIAFAHPTRISSSISRCALRGQGSLSRACETMGKRKNARVADLWFLQPTHPHVRKG